MKKQANIFRTNAKTFSFASWFLPKSIISKIHILYEFCRIVDNIADSSRDHEASKQTLQSIRSDILTGYSADQYLKGFLDFLANEHLGKAGILSLIDGVISDCSAEIRFKTEEELITYCTRVAGSVGDILCPLLGVSEKNIRKASHAAIHLGIAMQLTNIARDIQEDAFLNRIYIPSDWNSSPLDIEMLKNRPLKNEKEVLLSCKRLLDLADAFYDSAWGGYPFLGFSSRVCVMVAAHLYKSIGQKIRNKKYAYWQGRVYLTTPEKLFETLSLLPQLLNPLFWFPLFSTDEGLTDGSQYVNNSL